MKRELDDIGKQQAFNQKEMAEKLDSMMCLAMDYLRQLYQRSQNEAMGLFVTVLRLFERIVLPTHKSRYTQFVVFFLATLNAEFPDMFLGMLMQKALDLNRHILERQTSVAYMASFVARFKSVDLSTLRSYFDLTLPWIHSYIANMGPQVDSALDLEHHALFYSLCQSLLYVFCFRHRDLLAMEGGLDYCRRMGFDRIVTCSLNPLRRCCRASSPSSPRYLGDLRLPTAMR